MKLRESKQQYCVITFGPADNKPGKEHIAIVKSLELEDLNKLFSKDKLISLNKSKDTVWAFSENNVEYKFYYEFVNSYL